MNKIHAIIEQELKNATGMNKLADKITNEVMDQLAQQFQTAMYKAALKHPQNNADTPEEATLKDLWNTLKGGWKQPTDVKPPTDDNSEGGFVI